MGPVIKTVIERTPVRHTIGPYGQVSFLKSEKIGPIEKTTHHVMTFDILANLLTEWNRSEGYEYKIASMVREQSPSVGVKVWVSPVEWYTV